MIAAGARVTAIDRSARRMRRLRENLTRLKIDARTIVAEAENWAPGEPVDAILLDAPCSATGTIRRHPDAPYLKQPGDIAVFNETQDRLLHAAIKMLPPGGLLVYAVCSLQAEEGPGRIGALLDSGAPLRRIPIEAHEIGDLADAITADGDLRTFPFHLAEQGGMDAFFAARLQKL
jgi:16S rRNA (cytosine967-C5)-methyltransferase